MKNTLRNLLILLGFCVIGACGTTNNATGNNDNLTDNQETVTSEEKAEEKNTNTRGDVMNKRYDRGRQIKAASQKKAAPLKKADDQ